MVDAREVDFAKEGDVGGCVGVIWAAVDFEGVDAVFVDALCIVGQLGLGS